MQSVLNLLAAMALLVWGTYPVRTGVLRLLGERLRQVITRSAANRASTLLAGVGVTGLVQSSPATAMIAASMVAKRTIATSVGLALMLGAEIGTSLMVIVFSFDLAWLAPVLIVAGVVLFLSRQNTLPGWIGRIVIGFGLIILALQLMYSAAAALTAMPVVQTLLAALPNEVLLDVAVGAVLTLLAYSSLAVVLLTATLAVSGIVPELAALGIVVGANLGSGIRALILTAQWSPQARRVPVGSFLFKLAGCVITLPFLPALLGAAQSYGLGVLVTVVGAHLLFNVVVALSFIGVIDVVAVWLHRWLPDAPRVGSETRPQHLDPAALATPSLAITCAAREAMHQADVVETMLRGILPVIRHDDQAMAERLRALDDSVDELYSAIKFYLTQISREALSEEEGRRWGDIVSFTINMEQIGDIVERVLQDIEDKKIRKQRAFSAAGLAEICDLHTRLVGNLRLAMSVFLDGHIEDARRLLEEKARFRTLEIEYAGSHIARLQDNTPQSIETSALHLDLISDLKRINSHICSIAYPILEQAGELAGSRLKREVG